MKFGSPETIQIEILRSTSKDASPDGKDFSFELVVGGKSLTAGTSVSGVVGRTVEMADLRDIASWLAYSWPYFLDHMDPPPSLPGDSTMPFAQRASIETRFSDEAYDWLEIHNLEFAASYFCLPHVIFQRKGDAMNISWVMRPESYPWGDYRFSEPPGEVDVPLTAFKNTIFDFMEAVLGLASEGEEDMRFPLIRQMMARRNQ